MLQIQQFKAKFPTMDVIEVAVLENGQPTDEHGYVQTGTGQIIDAATFLALYERAQPVMDSGKRRRGRPPEPAKLKAAPAARHRAAKPAGKPAAKPVAKPAATVAAKRKSPPPKSEIAKPERATYASAIRACLAGGPKKLADIVEYVQNHGFEGVEDRNISNMVYQLRYTNQVIHAEDGTYTLPGA